MITRASCACVFLATQYEETNERTGKPNPLGKKRRPSSVLGRETPDVNDLFEFHEELGRGQFGTTFLVTEKATGRKCACKAISKRQLQNEDDIEEVRNEVRILHHLSGHDHVVELVGAYEGSKHVYIVMELLAGGELFDRIVEKGKYSEKDASETLRTIVQTVEYCHQLSVMHRDLKPENFVLKDKSSESPICAIDFGLSTFFRDSQIFTDLVGSPYYVAPEVLRRRYGPEADIWSCGIILYILLSGVPPFWAQTEQGIFDAILAGSLDLESDPWPKVSSEAKELISGMLRPDPKKRMTASQVLKHPWVADPNVAPARKLDNVVFKRFKNFAGITKFKKMGLMAMARTMTSDEVAGLKELFKSFDTDNSGTISIDELRQGLKVKAAGPAMEELRAIMKTIDIDGSGELDYEEFIAATLAQSKQQSDEAVRRAFDYFDKDGDGSITVEEFEEAFAKMSPIERANLGDIGELIASADTDGDGCIDYKEFMAMMKQR